MNTVYLIFRLLRESNYVTVLSESTVVGEHGLCAIPIEETNESGYDMVGCVHLLKNHYLKRSAQEFISMLGESSTMLKKSFGQM